MEISEEQLRSMFKRISPQISDFGTSIDSVHPEQIKHVREATVTGWAKSADPRDMEGALNCVEGRILLVESLDEWKEPIKPGEYVLHHRYVHPQRKSKDVSATGLTPRTMSGEKDVNGNYSTIPLRKRFPDAFQEFEAVLKRERKPFPIFLLDTVPPEVLETCAVTGFDSVQAFADASDEDLKRIAMRLDDDRHSSRTPNLHAYRQRARDYVGYTGDDAQKRGKRAA